MMWLLIGIAAIVVIFLVYRSFNKAAQRTALFDAGTATLSSRQTASVWNTNNNGAQDTQQSGAILNRRDCRSLCRLKCEPRCIVPVGARCKATKRCWDECKPENCNW